MGTYGKSHYKVVSKPGCTLFGSYLIPKGGIRAWFHSLSVSLMLSRLCFSCMGSWYIVNIVMHDVVIMLCHYILSACIELLIYSLLKGYVR